MNEFIEIPDDKGNVHHFHRHDLESYRDGYFSYKPQGGFETPLSEREITVIVDKPTPPDALVEAVRSALDVGIGMIDPENQPPQWSHEEAMQIMADAKKFVETIKTDGLVETLHKILHGNIPEGRTYDDNSKIIDIEAALAAHKKAGG